MPRIYPPRTYAPAWKACKLNGSVRLKVAPHLMKRVRRAIIKEKDEDQATKLEIDVLCIKPKMLKFSYNMATWELKVELKDYTRIRIEDLV